MEIVMKGTAVVAALLVSVAACAGHANESGRHDPTADRAGSLLGGSEPSCVESYGPQRVSRRAFAFDGEVVEIGPSVTARGQGTDLDLVGVTFEVREWFSGGAGGIVTVDLQGAAGSSSNAEVADGFDIGSRLLVSGEPRWGGSALEQPIAWSCGFTRYYDAETAMAWREATQS
ncbi:hypothetical protein [Nocardioides flavescens]|uniref:DM13 domain-containing protein n=1 Tax=Nocardioides flavescens TaxID=2691959 RepID=A0A6L7F2S0_9ACTN|nr:hypothetical protein [Nocardioides flavescens]MXG91502.1 hypothetical protein [Nocardioides flavescens]